MIAVLAMTDGRDDLLERTIASFQDKVKGRFTELWIHDDTGSQTHATALQRRHPRARIIVGTKRLGFGGAIQNAWDHITRLSEASFVFHLEDDFIFNRVVWADDMVGVLKTNRNIVQVALRRQPWNEAERKAGGVVELKPDAYHDEYVWDNTVVRASVGLDPQLRSVLLHQEFFTTNPSVYRRSLCAGGWPDGEDSEGRFKFDLLRIDPDAVFAYWGERTDDPWVEHIGVERAGKGY